MKLWEKIITLIHDFIKPVIYCAFLCCTCFLIAYFMGWLTDDPSFRKALWFIAVILDCFLQYMWWLSLITIIRPLKYVLWFMCALYLFYAIPSAIIYFNNEMARKETIAINNTYEINLLKKRLGQIQNELDSIAEFKKTEAKTGYRTRSQAIKDDKDSLVNEQNEKLAKLNELTKENTSNGSGNPLKGLNWYIGIIVGITIFMFYFGEFLIIWDMTKNSEIGSVDNSTSKPLPQIKPNETIVTEIDFTRNHGFNDAGLSVTQNTKSRYCQYSKCGELLPEHLRTDAKYCNDNCKQAAFREERKQKLESRS